MDDPFEERKATKKLLSYFQVSVAILHGVIQTYTIGLQPVFIGDIANGGISYSPLQVGGLVAAYSAGMLGIAILLHYRSVGRTRLGVTTQNVAAISGIVAGVAAFGMSCPNILLTTAPTIIYDVSNITTITFDATNIPTILPVDTTWKRDIHSSQQFSTTNEFIDRKSTEFLTVGFNTTPFPTPPKAASDIFKREIRAANEDNNNSEIYSAFTTIIPEGTDSIGWTEVDEVTHTGFDTNFTKFDANKANTEHIDASFTRNKNSDLNLLAIYIAHLLASVMLGATGGTSRVIYENLKPKRENLAAASIASHSVGFITAACASALPGRSWATIYMMMGMIYATLSVLLTVIRYDNSEEDNRTSEPTYAGIEHKLPRHITHPSALCHFKFICLVIARVLSTYFIEAMILLAPLILAETFPEHNHLNFAFTLVAGAIWFLNQDIAPAVGWEILLKNQTYQRRVLMLVLAAWSIMGIAYYLTALAPSFIDYLLCGTNNNGSFGDAIGNSTIIPASYCGKNMLFGLNFFIVSILLLWTIFSGQFMYAGFLYVSIEHPRNPVIQARRENASGLIAAIFGSIPSPILFGMLLTFTKNVSTVALPSENVFLHYIPQFAVRHLHIYTIAFANICCLLVAIILVILVILVSVGLDNSSYDDAEHSPTISSPIPISSSNAFAADRIPNPSYWMSSRSTEIVTENGYPRNFPQSMQSSETLLTTAGSSVVRFQNQDEIISFRQSANSSKIPDSTVASSEPNAIIQEQTFTNPEGGQIRYDEKKSKENCDDPVRYRRSFDIKHTAEIKPLIHESVLFDSEELALYASNHPLSQNGMRLINDTEDYTNLNKNNDDTIVSNAALRKEDLTLLLTTDIQADEPVWDFGDESDVAIPEQTRRRSNQFDDFTRRLQTDWHLQPAPSNLRGSRSPSPKTPPRWSPGSKIRHIINPDSRSSPNQSELSTPRLPSVNPIGSKPNDTLINTTTGSNVSKNQCIHSNASSGSASVALVSKAFPMLPFHEHPTQIRSSTDSMACDSDVSCSDVYDTDITLPDESAPITRKSVKRRKRNRSLKRVHRPWSINSDNSSGSSSSSSLFISGVPYHQFRGMFNSHEYQQQYLQQQQRQLEQRANYQSQLQTPNEGIIIQPIYNKGLNTEVLQRYNESSSSNQDFQPHSSSPEQFQRPIGNREFGQPQRYPDQPMQYQYRDANYGLIRQQQPSMSPQYQQLQQRQQKLQQKEQRLDLQRQQEKDKFLAPYAQVKLLRGNDSVIARRAYDEHSRLYQAQRQLDYNQRKHRQNVARDQQNRVNNEGQVKNLIEHYSKQQSHEGQ